MKYAVIACLAAILGLGLGAAISVAEFGAIIPIKPTLAMGAGNLIPNGGGPPPNAIVKESEFDFGEMSDDEVGKHTFVIKNDGPGMLDVSPGPKACKCTQANISKGRIKKGESTDVSVEWRPLGNFGEFARSISVLTNDPSKPTINLQIHGQVLPTYRVDPVQLVLGNVSSKESREVTARVLFFHQPNVEILGHHWSNKDSQEYFGLTYEPVPAEELDKAKARCGYDLTITIRSGARLGPLTQTLVLDTSVPLKTPLILPLYGQVSADVAFIGLKNYDHEKNVLYLGSIPQGTRKSQLVQLLVVGKQTENFHVKVARVSPPDLMVTIGKPSALTGRQSSTYPIWVVVPEDAKPVALLGNEEENMGQIVLETNNPEYKELKIFVQIAVTDKAQKAE